ncbi:preprotein translocase subunit SecY [Oenococcus alcoholitolerans]|uniref:preprotein translocase subunit SecY n=1 Tax=Oenococcus alcoholitolerans TaxID=931074 RepID=UPI003F704267
MFNLLTKALKQKEIRVRIYWTLFILLVYRFGAYITVPGINTSALTRLMDQTSLLSILNLFSGGGLSSYSLFALGVSPYVTAQIVIQLLQMDIVPKLVEWSKQGETGRRKTNQVTRYLTIAFAFFQSLGITAGLNALGQPIGVTLLTNTSLNSFLTIASVMTIGSMLSVWLGEQIQEKGVGNGISMIIFAGIVAQTIPGIWQIFQDNVLQGPGLTGIITFVVMIAALLIVVTIVTWFYGAVRRLPMQYTRSERDYGEESYLPLRVNVSGVIPVIFASSLITTPQTILQAFVGSWGNQSWYRITSQIFSLQTWQGTIFYGLLIILFTFFYAFVQVNPEKTADNLQKQGSYIVGVRPGNETKEFFSRLLNSLSGPGSIFLALVAVVPLLAQNFGLLDRNSGIGLGGTSLLIVIGVAVDLMRQIEGLTEKKNYVGLIRSHPFYEKQIKEGKV